MTLIAFATHGDHAEFITDTTSYTLNGSALGHCTKHLALPHLDAAILTQGDNEFANSAKVHLLDVSSNVATFDDLTKAASGLLRNLWEHFTLPDSDGMVILLGYSPDAGSFQAHLYASDSDFIDTKVTETWAHPMPWTARPTDLEVGRHRNRLGPEAPDFEVEAIRNWLAKPALPPHHGIDEWRFLAMTIREQRALTEYGRVFVAGSVIHTRLERGKMTTQKIHEFDDQGEEFLRMVEWTFHPVAQLMECHCGSGERFLDCHLREFQDQPCTCGTSSKLFRDCCMVRSA